MTLPSPARDPLVLPVVPRTSRGVLLGIALASIHVLFVLAGVAPLLVNRAPLLLVEAEGLSFPALHEATRADLRWFFLVLAYGVVRALLAIHGRRGGGPGSRRRGRVLIAGGGVLGFLLAVLLTAPLKDRLYPKEWQRWAALRDRPEEGMTVVWAPVRWDPAEIDAELYGAAPPSLRHPLGTDTAGRDVAARLIFGTRISLIVGFASVALALLIGVPVGALAGFLGGWVDLVLSRVMEVMLCIPQLYLLLAVVAAMPPDQWMLVILLGLFGWTGVARLTRAEFLRLRHAEFVLAARALGVGRVRLVALHILPHALSPVLVAASLGVAAAILAEASLSYLGLGVPPPAPTWGQMLQDGRGALATAPWLTAFPGLFLFAAVASFHLVGERVRDWLDPRWHP